ncbi:MAG: tetratricopeptide repeat protein [Planctomycetes bacterium]|nr:tetratricopeptide repeat protein [Planctomycetota bacterium]
MSFIVESVRNVLSPAAQEIANTPDASDDELKILEDGVRETGDRASLRLLEARAVALAEAGRTDDAMTAFQELLVKDPANPTATAWLTRLKVEPDGAP